MSSATGADALQGLWSSGLGGRLFSLGVVLLLPFSALELSVVSPFNCVLAAGTVDSWKESGQTLKYSWLLNLAKHGDQPH